MFGEGFEALSSLIDTVPISDGGVGAVDADAEGREFRSKFWPIAGGLFPLVIFGLFYLAYLAKSQESED